MTNAFFVKRFKQVRNLTSGNLLFPTINEFVSSILELDFAVNISMRLNRLLLELIEVEIYQVVIERAVYEQVMVRGQPILLDPPSL